MNPYLAVIVFLVVVILCQHLVIYYITCDKRRLEELSGWKIHPDGRVEAPGGSEQDS